MMKRPAFPTHRLSEELRLQFALRDALQKPGDVESLHPLVKRYGSTKPVLLFVLKHRASLTDLFGAETIDPLVSKENIEALKQVYSAKGYDFLIPQIEALACTN